MQPFLAFAGGTSLGNCILGVVIVVSGIAYIIWLVKRKL
jgi:hypothetical protein